ncbi:MAG TPA: hypothetical protein VJA26_04050 [Gammaproteobacteria bacterium]|nr:hypothetical protein [Gammaproteobacteria bacterium]
MRTTRTFGLASVLMIGTAVPLHHAAAQNETFPIGVEVELHPKISGHWPQGRSEDVVDALTALIKDQLNALHPHWTFVDDASPDLLAAVHVAVLERGVNEMLLDVSLRLKPPNQTGVTRELGEVVLYPPAHFDSYGRPTPTDAQAEIWSRVETLLSKGKGPHLAELSQQVPLARDPEPFAPGGTAVLPLSKDRYELLAMSTFRLVCERDQRFTNLTAEASGEWAAYGTVLPAALKVKLEADIPDDELGLLKPLLVYLQEYKVQNDWVFVSGSDSR